MAVGHPPEQQGNANFTNHMQLWKLKGLKFVPICKPEENGKETAVYVMAWLCIFITFDNVMKSGESDF